MKNVHLLPTDKRSRLWKNNLLQGKLELSEELLPYNTSQNIYITSDEEIKEGDWIFANQGVHKVIDIKNDKYPYGTLNHKGDKIYHHKSWKKIILTTDQDLIKDGVQAIDDEFLEWFVKNPSCEEVEAKLIEEIPSGFTFGMFGNDEPPTELVYKIIIPKEEPKQELPQLGTKEFNDLASAYFEGKLNHLASAYFGGEPKQETLEEAAESYWVKQPYNEDAFIEGANWQAKRMYSEEDIALAFNEGQAYSVTGKLVDGKEWAKIHKKEWFEQFKKK